MNSRLRAAAPPPVGLRRRSSRPGGDGTITLAPTPVTTWLPPEGWQMASAGWGTDAGWSVVEDPAQLDGAAALRRDVRRRPSPTAHHAGDPRRPAPPASAAGQSGQP